MANPEVSFYTCNANTPSYAKHVSSTSARILTGCGVIRLRTFFMIASRTSSVKTSIGLPSFTCAQLERPSATPQHIEIRRVSKQRYSKGQ